MTGEQRRSTTERVRKDAGRVAIAAMVAAVACAPAAAANGKGNGNGNGGGNAGSPPAHAGHQGPPPHANNDGNRSSSRNGGSRGNSGNAPGRSHGNPSPGTRPSQAPPSWSNAGGNRRSGNGSAGTPPRGDRGSSKKSDRGNNGAAHQKTTICHATGSDTNPYVRITISDRALKAHAAHQDGRDIIPAPDGECPKAEVTAAATEAIAGLAPAFESAIPGPPAAAPASADGQPAGATQAEPAATGDVAGVEAHNETADAGTAGEPAAASERGAERGESGGSLPFTGLAVLMLAIAGALLVATGVGLKRSRATHT